MIVSILKHFFIIFYILKLNIDKKFKRNYSQTYYLRMFQEDISKNKMPIKERLKNFPNFKVTISGSQKELAKKILVILSGNNYRNSDTNLISDVINNLARSVYYFRRIYIIKSSKDNEHEIFFKIQSYNIIKIFKLYFQFIPEKKGINMNINFKILKEKDVFFFSIFKNPFSWVKYNITKKILNLSDEDEITPKFFKEDGFQSKDFDMNTYTALKIRIVSLITKSYAWNLRSVADEHSNEYFKIYFAYKSAIQHADDREMLLSQVNKMLSHFKIDASIEIVGIPSSKNLKKSLVNFEAGKINFSQALNEIYLL